MLVVGAVINTSVPGVDEMIEKRDKKKLLELAMMQMHYGAEMLAINCGTRINSEPDDVEWMFTTIQNEIEIPLCIDSPNPEAHRAGLRVHKHGRAMVDSITAEKSRIQTIMPIVKKYNSTVVALLHDEQGIPTDVEGRLRVIPKIISAAKEYEVKPQDIFLDCMVYPLSVGTDNGRIYLEALKQVKTMYPDYKTICGLNNISYGLPQTNLLNQAFVTACAALGQEAVFIEIDNITGATLKAINALLGNDSNLTNYLKAFRGNDLNIYNRRDD